MIRKTAAYKGRASRRAAACLAALTALWACLNQYEIAAYAAQGEEAMQAGEEATALETQTIAIKGAEDFLEFARQCQTAVYSENKRFVLETDLDLSGTSFEAIPAFSGFFEGGGHSITGMELKAPGSKCGLFRYVEAGATVQNLNVEGRLVPGGDQEKTGGIAGINEGTIVNCTFQGAVIGDEMIGGIAGSNEESGVIRSCVSRGEISGRWKAGGIAGNNEGIIENCVNESLVNTDEELLDAEKDEDMSVDLDSLNRGLKADIVNDIGGIAGYSSGTLRQCVNQGLIGCQHMGNNVGGIAGRQNGLAEGCQNQGTVTGSRNVAGIAGHFEPYLEKFYESDTFDELDAQMDALEEIKNALSDQMRGMGDRAGDHMDALDVLTEELKNMTRDFSDEREGKRDVFDEEASSQMNVIEEIVDRMELDVESDSARDAYEEIKEELANGRRILSGLKKAETEVSDEENQEDEDGGDEFDALEDAYQEAMGLVSELERSGRRIVNNVEIIWEDGVGDAVDSIQDFADDLEALRTEAQDLTDMVEDYKDELSDDMKGFKDRMRDKTDEISAEKDRMTDQLDADKDLSQSIKDQMDDQMDEISDTIDDGKDKLKEEADKREEEDYRIFEDVSGENTDVLGNGLILNCANSGGIFGDYQTGGISGIIGYEQLLNREQDPETDEERSFNLSRTARALIRGCRNTGEIVAENDYAGGIVGVAKLGMVLSNRNFSDVETKDGDYAGGIAGYAAGGLAGNYMKGTVIGKDYVGGIAGYGKTVEGNLGMSVIKTSEPEDDKEFVPGEYHGSIVGDLDEDGALSGNIYVDHGLGANGGITHKQEAEGLSYEQLLQREDIPSEFYQIQVKFYVDDKLIKTVDCEYGQTVQDREIPELPEKSGFYGTWEKEKLENVLLDQSVHGLYYPYVTAIASSDDKKPVMMAEGAFYPDAQLAVWEEAAAGGETPEGYQMVKVMGYQLSFGKGENSAEEGLVRARIYAGSRGKHMAVAVKEGEQLKVLPSEHSGEYLIFETAPQGTLVLLEKKGGSGIAWAAGAGFLAAAWGAWFFWKRKKAKRGAGGKEEEHEDDQEEKEENDSGSGLEK